MRFSSGDKHPGGASIFVYSLQTFIRKFGFQNQLNLFQQPAEMDDKPVKAAQSVACRAPLIGPFIAPSFTSLAFRTNTQGPSIMGRHIRAFCTVQQQCLPTFFLLGIKKNVRQLFNFKFISDKFITEVPDPLFIQPVNSWSS